MNTTEQTPETKEELLDALKEALFTGDIELETEQVLSQVDLNRFSFSRTEKIEILASILFPFEAFQLLTYYQREELEAVLNHFKI